MSDKADLLRESPSQTAGPYVHIGCLPQFAGIAGHGGDDLGSNLITGDVAGERISLSGQIFDGLGEPVTDAMVELWQADASGLFNARTETRGTPDPNFNGWGRCPTDPESGLFMFETIKPGPVLFHDDRMQAPHVTLWIVARGISLGLHTRAYFEDHAASNAVDPILSAIPEKSRVPTLIATKDSPGRYRFDIRLQGDRETVFFNI